MQTTTSPLIRQLKLSQFANFLAEMWNSEALKAWGESTETLWEEVAKREFQRNFCDGYDYCESELTFTPRTGRFWRYETTSGTLIVIQQGCWTDDDGNLPEISITIEIPQHRSEGNHAKALEYYSSTPCAEFFEWGSLFYAKEGTPQHAEARRRGMAIDGDPEVIAMEEERKAKRLEKAKCLEHAASLGDCGGEEFDYDPVDFD